MAVDPSKKARAYLQELRFAVLATINQDGTPQLTTMWYLLEDDGTILMNTKVGRLKERNMISSAFQHVTMEKRKLEGKCKSSSRKRHV